MRYPEPMERRVLFAGDFVWAHAHADRGSGVANDASGATVVSGVEGAAAALWKYDAAGTLLWKRSFKGTGEQNVQGVAIDATQSVILTGYFSGTLDLNPGAGVNNVTAKGAHDAFVVKLDADGSFKWARTLGGTSEEGATGVAVDGSGNVLVLGMFAGTGDYNPGANVASLWTRGAFDVSVTKLTKDGTFVWTRSAGGTGEDFGNGIAADASGNAIVTGTFRNTARFTPDNALSLTSVGGKDAFVWKIAGASGQTTFARRLGGSGDDQAGDVRVDPGGNIVSVGSFSGTADFDPGAGTRSLTSAGATDAYISKLSTAGNFVWAHRVGGSGADRATDLAIDASSSICLTGQFRGSVDFNPGAGVNTLTSHSGSNDAFVLKLASTGSYAWSRGVGSSSNVDVGEGIATRNGRVVVAGVFGGTIDLDPGAGTYWRTASGTSDLFLLVLTT